MKLKSAFVGVLSLVAMTAASNAATLLISNVVTAGGTAEMPGDTLYTNANGQLLSGGIVTIGYFNAGFDVAANVNDKDALVANFTVVTSALAGGQIATLNGAFAGYAEGTPEGGSTGDILDGNPLLGRAIYSFIGNFSTLAASDQIALVQTADLKLDVPVVNTYTSNPKGGVVVIGTTGTLTGEFAGEGTQGVYGTLQLAPIPEPSVALLGLLGAAGLLRRRR